MALINCPECNTEISDKAKNCIKCGYPISGNIAMQALIQKKQDLKFPVLPSDLDIGKQITNWGGNAYFKGEVKQSENVLEVEDRSVNIAMHHNGVLITYGLLTPLLELHNKQIISFKKASNEELSSTDKSVVGRAVLGGLILGPLGAVVGGMSGVNKSKLKDIQYLIINYWDLESKSPSSVLIRGSKTDVTLFIDKWQKQIEKQEIPEQNLEQSKKGKGCLKYIGIAFVIFIILILIAG